MTGIASSLEQEFAERSQAERERDIAALRQLDADGRGTVEVRASAIFIGILMAGFGAAMLYVVFAKGAFRGNERLGFIAGGVLLCAIAAWLLFLRSRQPLFVLTEKGVDVRGVLLPWSSIDDYGVLTHSINGASSVTTVTFEHVEGYAAPPLPLFRGLGQSVKDRKTGMYRCVFNLYVKPRGMNGEKLAGHIGRLHAGALAREELRQLGA